MFKETLYEKTEHVLEQIESNKIFNDFYLAGGTALALQLGHRKSIDLDWFSPNFPGNDVIKQNIAEYVPIIIHETHGTLDAVIHDVKVTFLEYRYPLLEDLISFEHFKMASVLDIACMKLSAVSSRGSKKDFVDLWFIMKKHPLTEIFEAFRKKFSQVSYQEIHMLKSLAYFDDADVDPDPDYLEEIDWNIVKRDIENEIRRLI